MKFGGEGVRGVRGALTVQPILRKWQNLDLPTHSCISWFETHSPHIRLGAWPIGLLAYSISSGAHGPFDICQQTEMRSPRMQTLDKRGNATAAWPRGGDNLKEGMIKRKCVPFRSICSLGIKFVETELMKLFTMTTKTHPYSPGRKSPRKEPECLGNPIIG